MMWWSRFAVAFLLAHSVSVSVAWAQAEPVRVVASNSQTIVDDFEFQVPTNAANFSGPSVSPSGWVFFTMGVKNASGGLGDALFAVRGGAPQVLLGPDELGGVRLIPQTIELLDVPKVRATERDTALVRATVGGTDGLWEVSPLGGTPQLIAEEGANGIASVGILGSSTANQFWGHGTSVVTFRAEASFIPTLYVHDGSTTTAVLAENGDAPGTGGTIGQLGYVGVDDDGQIIVATTLTVDTADGPRAFAALLKSTGLGIWDVLAGTPTPMAGAIASIDDRIHVGRGGHVVFRGSYFTAEDPPGSGFWGSQQGLIRVSPDGQIDVLTDAAFAISETHTAPNGYVYAAEGGFGNPERILYAAPGASASPSFTAGDPGFGTGDFVRAYAFASDDTGDIYISGESSTGQVVVRYGPNGIDELFSDQFTFDVDGEDRVAEQLYFDDAGPFASSDGSVVCARMDLDAPTDVGVVCTGQETGLNSIAVSLADEGDNVFSLTLRNAGDATLSSYTIEVSSTPAVGVRLDDNRCQADSTEGAFVCQSSPADLEPLAANASVSFPFTLVTQPSAPSVTFTANATATVGEDTTTGTDSLTVTPDVQAADLALELTTCTADALCGIVTNLGPNRADDVSVTATGGARVLYTGDWSNGIDVGQQLEFTAIEDSDSTDDQLDITLTVSSSSTVDPNLDNNTITDTIGQKTRGCSSIGVRGVGSWTWLVVLFVAGRRSIGRSRQRTA